MINIILTWAKMNHKVEFLGLPSYGNTSQLYPRTRTVSGGILNNEQGT